MRGKKNCVVLSSQFGKVRACIVRVWLSQWPQPKMSGLGTTPHLPPLCVCIAKQVFLNCCFKAICIQHNYKGSDVVLICTKNSRQLCNLMTLLFIHLKMRWQKLCAFKLHSHFLGKPCFRAILEKTNLVWCIEFEIDGHWWSITHALLCSIPSSCWGLLPKDAL